MLLNMVCCRPRHAESPCGNLGPAVFVVRPDQEEIGIIVALESGAQLAIKREGESCIAFIRIKFISKRDVEHLSLR